LLVLAEWWNQYIAQENASRKAVRRVAGGYAGL
jgi:hypothetical protein